VTEGQRKTQNEELNNLYSSLNIIGGNMWQTWGYEKYIQVDKSGRKKSLGRHRIRCWANIKLDLKIIRCEDMNLRQMALVEGPIMCFYNYGNKSLGAIRGASHMTIKFLMRTFLHGDSYIFCSHSYVTILLM
jgi:hypothetical protein